MISKKERQTVFSISFVYAFRMLGLFMILPVFSVYAHQYAHANGVLVGVALGIYGLTQACLQIPFGMSSDHIGRKPVIIGGLLLFAIGSVIAAEAHSIYAVILGRALQGAGAIGSTLTALVADNTQENNRLKAMSIVGMTIGLAFMVAIILGPFLNQWIGLAGIFWFTAVLALLGILIVLVMVPSPKRYYVHRDSEAVLGQFAQVLKMPELLRLNFGIFCQHAILTALFIVAPLILLNKVDIATNRQWLLYLPVLILSFFAMIPGVIAAESRRKMKPVFVTSVLIIGISLLLLWQFHQSLWGVGFILFLFFTAFTLLEACLPSLVAKISPAGSKGTAMGIYSSCQFLGIFFGGLAGGYIFHHGQASAVILFCSGLAGLWLAVAVTMKKPEHVSSKVIALPDHINENTAPTLAKQLKALSGVKDVMLCLDERAVYLKVDKKQLDENELSMLLTRNS